MKKIRLRKISLSLLLLAILFLPVCAFAEEKITLTTYYPAPYGVYKELRADQAAVGSAYRNVALSDGKLLVSGNVGIGTSVPREKFSIVQVDGEAPINFHAGGTQAIAFNAYYSGSNWRYVIDENAAKIHFGSSGLQIDTVPAGTAGTTAPFATRIFIKNDGNVGIGTINPVGLFHVGSQSAAPLFVASPTGNVGIGTTNPVFPLTLKGTAAQIIGMEQNIVNGAGSNLTLKAGGAGEQNNNMNGNNGGDLYLSSGAATAQGGSEIYFQTVAPNQGAGDNVPRLPATRMTILGNGYVGIGTTIPRNKLDVEGSMAVGASYSGTYTATSNGMIVQGNVGIGTSSPRSMLDVRGVGNYCVRVAFTSNSGTQNCPDGYLINLGSATANGEYTYYTYSLVIDFYNENYTFTPTSHTGAVTAGTSESGNFVCCRMCQDNNKNGICND